MKIPEVIVKEFKRISFALAEDEALFDRLKNLTLEDFWQNIDQIVEQKGIYRTMESDHIAFLLDRLDQLLEEGIEIIKRYEMGEEYKSSLVGPVSNNLEQSAQSQTAQTQKQQAQSQQQSANKKTQSSNEMVEEVQPASPFVPVSRQAKEKADAQILKILQIESRLLKKDQYKFLYRQLDRILDILNWSDSLKIKRCALYILLLIVVIEEGSPKQELIYLKQHQLDEMSFFVRYYILHINSFNEGYTELSGLFKFDDQRYYKLEQLYNPKYKTTNILDFEKAYQIQRELEEQDANNNFIDQKTSTAGTSDTFTPPDQEIEDVVDQEEILKTHFRDKEEEHLLELEKRARHFEFIENSINTKPLNSLSIKPILQKLQGDKLITFQLKYDDSLTLYQNVKKIYKDNLGKDLDNSICLFGGIKERLIILKNLKCRESRIEIAKIFLISIQILSFLMKVTKKHMQSIITDQQLAFEKFQKSFPKQVTDLIHLKLDPKIHADVIKFMLIIIKEQSQLKKTTEDYLSKQSDSLIIKIYTDCSNLELQAVQQNQEMEIECSKDSMIIENEDIRNRTVHKFKISSKGQTVQESTLLESKFIDYALTFVNTILKYPDNQGQSFQEVTPFSMNFVQIPFHSEYLTYNLKQIRKAIHSLSLMIQIEDIQREYKILYQILDKIEYYLDQKPKFQWIDGKWSPISQKQYDIFLGQLLRIINQIFETSTKRSRRITPQLAKQLTECPKFFIILGNCIDRIVKGYSEQESFNPIPSNPTIVHEDSEKILLIETVHLLSNINKENPNLIEKLLEEKIIQKTITALQALDLPHDTKSISQIIYFLYHISLKEQGRSEIMKSKLLHKIFEVFIDDNYAEEFYAYTLSSVIEAIQNYYNNIKEIVEIIYEKLNDLLICLRKKCATYTEEIERYLNFGKNEGEYTLINPTDINFNYRTVLCYQIFNVCKLIEKLIAGIENVYPDTKNKYAGECLLNYLEILQFPFLFLMPQRTTHKTPFFSVKTTCKAIYNKLDTKNEVETNKINKVLDVNIQKIEELFGKKIEDVTSLNLDLVNELTIKNFLKLIKDEKDVQYYKQIKLYQQLQFLDAMINTFRSLRITSLMSNYYGFVKKISCLFPITFNQRFFEQFSYVKQRITYLEDSALTLRKQYEQDNESLKHEEQNLENELKEFKLYFKENILSFKNHVNHYSYQNIIFYTILKLVYQNYSLNDDLEVNSPNKQDVLRLISLTINNIDLTQIDIKVLEKYDMKALEVFSSLAGILVMLTQILQIFMKESKLVNYMILNSLQKEGSITKVVELAKKFSEIWQQIELKSLLKNQKDADELSNLSKDNQAYYKKYQNLLANCIDHCLETINYKLEYFFKMVSLQIQFNLNFKKEQKEEYREDIRQGIYGWHYEQIKSQQMILKSIKAPSKNKYYSMLIEFLITHIELQLLPRYQTTKKFIESEKNEKAENANQLSEEQFNMLNTMFPKQSKEFFLFAIKEFKKDKQQFSNSVDINSFTEYILDKQEILQKQFTDQPDPSAIAQIESKETLISEADSISHILKIKKEDFFAKVKSDAEEMCQYLLRELFCYKNHSDQILALLMRKESAEIEFIKSTVTKIKELQQSEKKKQTAMEIEETKTAEEAPRRSRRGQSAGLHSSRQSDNTAGTSSIQIQQGGENPLTSTIHFPLIMRNPENRNQSANSAAGNAGSARQDQGIGLFQPSSSNNLNSLNNQNPLSAANNSNLNSMGQNGFQENQRLRNMILDQQFNDQLRYRLSQNRYQMGSRGRHSGLEASMNNNQQFMGVQKQDKDQQKTEQINQFKQQIVSWSDDHLINTFQSVQSNHSRISYVIFATLNLLVSKIFKDFKFKNPFKGSKETISKLRNNELLHVPSKLDSSSIYKLELINAIIPFAEKFGLYSFKELSNEKSASVEEQTENSIQASNTSTINQVNTTNQMQLNNKQSSSSNLTAEDQNSLSQKLNSIKLVNQEDLELKWKEGNESYSIGIEFIRIAKHLFSNGYSLFNTPKKGEDKEIHKQSSCEAITYFIKNQCHLIQKINQMNQKFKLNLKKDLEKAISELNLIQNLKKGESSPNSEKTSKDKQNQGKSLQISSLVPSNEDNSNKMIPEETIPTGVNLQQQDSKKKKNKNKKRKKSKKSKKVQQQPNNQMQNESGSSKQKANQKVSPTKHAKANANNIEEKKLQEKIKQLKESQNLLDSYEKEVISMFVSLLHFNNEQYDYYGQSLISVSILTFMLDTIKQYSENNKQYLNQFIVEKGIIELLKIRVQTDQIDLIIEKLNIFLTNITQDPVMAMANYESKIKYFFYEKCVHQQTLMYQINLPFTPKKPKRAKKDSLKKAPTDESLPKKTSSVKTKAAKEDSIFTAAASTEWNGVDTKHSPPKQQTSSSRRSVSPQKLSKAQQNLTSTSQQQQANQSIQQISQQLQQQLTQDLSINQIPSQISEKKQKKLKVSYEEFYQRFNSFKSIPLFQEVLQKLCDIKTLQVKQKAPKISSNGAQKTKQSRQIRQIRRQSLYSDFFQNETSFRNTLNRLQSNPNVVDLGTVVDAAAAASTTATASSQNQQNQEQSQQQQAQTGTENTNQNNQQVSSKEKKSIKNKQNPSSKKKGKSSKGKKKVMVQKQFYILKDDIQLHKLQLISKENFLSNQQNPTQIPAAPLNKKLSESNNSKDQIKRSSSSSKYVNKQGINLFKQKSEGKLPSIRSDQNLVDDLQGQGNKNANSQTQNNFNQMINFVAPTYIYETINQILESIVTQFTKKILQNYDLLHKKQSNKQQADQSDDYLFNNIILLKVIQIIARQQAILVPQIVRFRCSKIVKKIVQGHPLESVFNKQLGNHFHFLKFITKCANYFSISQVKGLIFELCLDKQILYEHCSHHTSHSQYSQVSNNPNHKIGVSPNSHNNIQQHNKIIPFGAEIRKKVLGEIYSSIESELANDQNILEKPHTIHILISNILLHLNLLNIREVAKLSLKNFTSDLTSLIENTQQQQSQAAGLGINTQDPHKGEKENLENVFNDSNGFNFAKLYGDILKKFDISKMSQMQNVIVFVTSILEMLYILNYYFILYPSGISGGKNDNKKKNDDFMSKFIQSQILPYRFQNHIKQYAVQHQGNFGGILSGYQQDQFGSTRHQFNFNFGRDNGLNQLNLFNRNVINFDPLSALSRFTQNAPNAFNMFNPIVGGNVSIRMNTDRDPSSLQDTFLSNHLRRNTAANNFISLATQARRQVTSEVDRLFRGINDNSEGNPLNEGNRDEEADHLITGRLDDGEDDEDDDDEEEDDEEEEEEEEDEEDQINYDQSVDEEEDEEGDDEDDDDEEEDEDEEDDESEGEEEEEEEEDDDVELDEDEVEEEEDEGEDEDLDDDEDGDELLLFNNIRIGLNRRMRRNVQSRENSSQRSDYQGNSSLPGRIRAASRSSRRGANRNDDNEEPGSQQSMGNQQEDFIAEEDELSLGEEEMSNMDEDEEVDINLGHQAGEEEEEEDDDDGEEVAIYLDFQPDGNPLIGENQIQIIEGQPEGDEENHVQYQDQEIEGEDIFDEDEELSNRVGSQQDWEDYYSSGDEISDIGDNASNDEFYEENSQEQEVDVRDREDDDVEEEEEGGDEGENEHNHEHQEEDEEENHDGLMSEEESNVWNDHEFSEDGSHIEDDDDDNSEDNDDEDVDEAFEDHPHVIDINNLVDEQIGDDEDDIEDDENEEGDEDRLSQMYDEDLEQNNEQDQANNDQNGERGEHENNQELNHLEEEEDEDDEEVGDVDAINDLIEVNFGQNRNRRSQDKDSSSKYKERVNEDPDCKKQQNSREITEFTNITMSECLKDSYRRCQQLIQVHYIGTTQQNIAYHTCLKEVQREVSLIEKQQSANKGEVEDEQNLVNSSPKKTGTGEVIIQADILNKIFDKSVYVALLIYYKHSNFESTYTKYSRNNYTQHHFMDNQGSLSNLQQQPQQDLGNTQMISSPYMANDRRSQAAQAHQNGDLTRATQYRLGVRMPHHMQMSQYNRHMHNRHQQQNRPVENQESDIPGSSLNELIQQVATANVQRNTSSNSTFNNLNQLIRGSITNLGSLGISNFNQLIRQNALFGNTHQILNTSSFGGQRSLMGRISQNNNIPSIGNLQSTLLEGGPLDFGQLNLSMRNPLGQMPSQPQLGQISNLQSMDILMNATSNSNANNNNNNNNISTNENLESNSVNQQQDQQLQLPQPQPSMIQEQTELSAPSVPAQRQESATSQQSVPSNALHTDLTEFQRNLTNSFNIILQANQPNTTTSTTGIAAATPPSNQNTNNQDQINQIVSEFTSIAPLLQASLEQREIQQTARSASEPSNQTVETSQLRQQQSSGSVQNTAVTSSSNANTDQIAQLVSGFNQIAPLLIASFDNSSQRQSSNSSINDASNNAGSQSQEPNVQRQQSQEQNRIQAQPTETMEQESTAEQTRPSQPQDASNNALASQANNTSQIQQPRNNITVPSQPNLSQNSIMVLSRLNLDASFLTRNGLDFQIFDELPDDIKEEMIFSYLQFSDNEPQATTTQVNEQISSTQADPNSLQQNSTENNTATQQPAQANNTARSANTQPATSAASTTQQVNQANVEFVNQSDINLRVDILLQSGEDFLRTLTPEMQEEARRLRETHGQVSRNTFNDFNIQRQRTNQSPSQNQQLMNQMVNEIFKDDNFKNQKKQLRLIDDWINKDQFIYKKLIETDDKFIESVLRLIYYGGKQPNIFPLQLLELICKNPSVEQKVFDSLMFILMNPNMQEIKQAYSKDKNQSTMVDEKKQEEDVFDFPLLNTYHRNSKETDYKKVYLDVSLKILRIIQKLTMKRVLFFVDTDIIERNNFIDMRPLIQIEKEKGNLGCIRELKRFAAEINSSLYAQKSFSLPYFQFIYLLTQEPFRSNYDHLNYLLSSIQNITRKLFQYHSGKQEIEEETISSLNAQLGVNARGAASSSNNQNTQNRLKDVQEGEFFDGVSKHSIFAKDNSFQLHPDVIRWICSIFSSECLNEILIKKLSLIINQLCYDKNNLEMFIAELRNIIKLFSIQINKQVVKCLQSIKSLDRNSPSFSSQFKIHLSQIEFSISGEKKIQKIFQIIYELFEKSFYQLEEESKKEGAQKNQSASKNDLNNPINENEMEEEEEEKKQDTSAGTQNTNVYGGNRFSSISQGYENTQHRNRGTSIVSNTGDPNKSSAKKQTTKQNIKEQERLENIKKEIRTKFSEIISHQNFNELWMNCAELFSILGKYEPNNLSSYNTAIEKLQPIMESYFIIFRIMHDEDFEFIKKSQPLKKSQQLKQISTLADDETVGNTEDLSTLDFETLKENIKELDIQQIFKFICEQCKVVINQMIRQNLKQKKSQNNRKMNDVLQKDPFEIIFKRHPSLIDFENKKNYFKQEMMNLKLTIASTSQRRRRIKVRRKHIFEDSFQQIDAMKPEELKQKFIIEFDQEEGIDAGGLIREWFIILSKAIFNPDYLLFKPSSTGNTYQPNKNSYLNEPHLQYFKFVGRVVGKALFEGQYLDAYFTRSFYKHILGQPLTYHDIEDQDYQFYKGLKWIMDNDISIMDDDLTFCYEENEFDNKEIVELKPNGQNIKVTEDNKQEYVKLVCYARMAKNIKAQIEHFLEGFHELIPHDLVKIFDSHELELMISGLPDIDIQDLRENTEYQNYTQNSKIIEWFWEIMEEFDNTMRASFLQFVTGTSKVPVEGFKGLRGISGLQKFQIHKAYDPKKLPIAHTCFNQLDIPDYPTKEVLKKKLLMAISEGKEGFGFA